MTKLATTQSTHELKLNLIREFKLCSSSELSFRRRVSAISLLDALCHITGLSWHAVLMEENQRDWVAVLNDNRNDPMVQIFMLMNNISLESFDFSPSDSEAVTWCFMELSKHLSSS